MKPDRISYRELRNGLEEVGITPHSRVLVHTSPTVSELLVGGAEAFVGAILASCETVLMPAFTPQTMVVPSVGPPLNGMEYGEGESNYQSVFFHQDLPVGVALGDIPELFRSHSRTRRSMHPILSFTGHNAGEALRTQNLEDPLGPVQWLADYDGDVLLFDVNHTSNIGIHLAEQVSGRKTFIRWALTPSGIVECPLMPGCSDGFQRIAGLLQGTSRVLRVGPVVLESIPLRDLLHIAGGWLREEPTALLCSRETCPCCSAVRAVNPG